MENIKDFLRPEIIWFAIGILLLISEFAMPGLIVFFFGVGACVVSAVCIFADISINAQLIIFIVSSVLLLVCLRRFMKGIFTGHVASNKGGEGNILEFVGERAEVNEKIVPKSGGKVEFHGTSWAAEADEEIEEGATVEIVGQNNITLKVKKL